MSPHGSFGDEEVPGAFARNGTCLSSSTNLHWIMAFVKSEEEDKKKKSPLGFFYSFMLHSGMNSRNFLSEENINYEIF